MTHQVRCIRCDKTLPADKPRVYSRFTGFYYCADVAGCDKRKAKKEAKAA